jgi:hypothetical protein
MFNKIKRGFDVVRESWLVTRVPPNSTIFGVMKMISSAYSNARLEGGFFRYLIDYPAKTQLAVSKDWYCDEPTGEWRLLYTSTLFADGLLRVTLAKKWGRGILIFFPGYQVGANDVLENKKHPQYMKNVARNLNMNLAVWDWPLQGIRRNNALYYDLQSVYSTEREYSRILPALGTCLWREFVAELSFSLKNIRRLVGPETPLYIVGWSMGGLFAYIAPLLGIKVEVTVSAGSCARIEDLMIEGKTRQHGYFFYPLNGLKYFDIDELVRDSLRNDEKLYIIYGALDAGCLDITRDRLIKVAKDERKDLNIEVIKNHGHVFSDVVKEKIVYLLSK